MAWERTEEWMGGGSEARAQVARGEAGLKNEERRRRDEGGWRPPGFGGSRQAWGGD